MSVVLVLLAASLAMATAFLLAFIWSVRNGQYDDDYTPSVRILFGEKQFQENQKNPHKNDTAKQDGTAATGRHPKNA